MKINEANYLQQNYYLNRAQKAGEKALENIAAARAISGVDSANLAIADSLRSQSSTIDQGVANAMDAIGLLQIADASLSQISKGTDRLSQLSVRLGSAALNERQKNMLRSEAEGIKSAINDSFNNATFNGKNVFSTLNFVVGTGSEGFSLGRLNARGLSIDKPESIESFNDSLNSLRSEIGAGIQAINSNINASIQASINTKAAQSKLLNGDLAANVTAFNAAYLQQNAGSFTLAHSNTALQSRIANLLN